MNIYVFSSKNLINIWAGIGAGLWAVSPSTAKQPVVRSSAQTRMPVGSLGVFYCSHPEVKGFTTPFVVCSAPDPRETVTDVWPEPWNLPFQIRALGTPRRLLPTDQAIRLLPTLRAAGPSRWPRAFHIQPMTAFQPSQVTDEDWRVLIQHLADFPPRR